MRFALLGAELLKQDVYSNYSRTCNLRNDLIKEGFGFVGVQNVAGARISQMFLVTGITDENEAKVIAIAKNYGQKALLISNIVGNMEVVLTDENKSKGRTLLGKLKSVDKASASLAQFYIIFDENGQRYYYTTSSTTNRKEQRGKANSSNARIQRSDQTGTL